MCLEAVGDDELLHRSVRADDCAIVDGRLRISSQAFNDAKRKPSVDRKILRPNPEETRKSPTDGVAQLCAIEIRSEVRIPIDGNIQGGPVYAVDVIPRPIISEPGSAANPSHAQVEADPDWINDSRFKKLKDALARLAERREFALPPVR